MISTAARYSDKARPVWARRAAVRQGWIGCGWVWLGLLRLGLARRTSVVDSALVHEEGAARSAEVRSG